MIFCDPLGFLVLWSDSFTTAIERSHNNMDGNITLVKNIEGFHDFEIDLAILK